MVWHWPHVLGAFGLLFVDRAMTVFCCLCVCACGESDACRYRMLYESEGRGVRSGDQDCSYKLRLRRFAICGPREFVAQ